MSSREHVVRLATYAAADAAYRAKTAPTPEAATALWEAAGEWATFAHLVMTYRQIPVAHIRQRLLMADMLAARAGEFAPPAHEPKILAAIFPPHN